jgi:hypothetical protein
MKKIALAALFALVAIASFLALTRVGIPHGFSSGR